MRHFYAKVIVHSEERLHSPFCQYMVVVSVFGGLHKLSCEASQPHFHSSNQLYPEECGQAVTSLYTVQSESPLKSGSM